MRLWTDKHRPSSPEKIAGQQKAVEAARRYLSSWKPGTALLLYGPPGTGKTLLVELLAAERGDFLVRLDASDRMTGKEIEAALNEAGRQRTLFHGGKLILIDEVDSLSGRSDRGASGSIVKVIAGSRYPVVICVNDIKDPKLRQIKKVCRKVGMGKLGRDDVSSFLSGIAKIEGVSVADSVLDGLARWSGGDLRSAILDFQMLCLGKKEVTDEHFLSLGFRERPKGMEDVLSGLMRTPSMKANRMSMWNADADPDDLFLWLESNIYKTTRDPAFLAAAYDALSRADIFRSRVPAQQNWRFKAYMSDVMAGVACLRNGAYVAPEAVRTPDRIILLSRARFTRAVMDPIIGKVCGRCHCSRAVARKEYVPYLRFIAGNGGSFPEDIGLTEEEVLAIKR